MFRPGPSGLYGWDRWARHGHAETDLEREQRLRNRARHAAAIEEADRLMDEKARLDAEDIAAEGVVPDPIERN